MARSPGPRTAAPSSPPTGRRPQPPAAIVALPIDGGPKRPLTAPPATQPPTSGDTQPRISPEGARLAFLRSGPGGLWELYVAALDGVAPPPHPLGGRLDRRHRLACRSLIAAITRRSEVGSLWRIPLNGEPITRLAESGIDPVAPAAAPRGRRLAFVTRISDTNLWRARLVPGKPPEIVQLTRTPMLDTSPQLSPDGRRIAWRGKASGADEIWVADADGANPRQLTAMKALIAGSPRWSPDGLRIAYECRSTGESDIYVVPAAGGASVRLTHDLAADSVPSFSRDGRFLYFASNRTGQYQVWRNECRRRRPATDHPARRFRRLRSLRPAGRPTTAFPTISPVSVASPWRAAPKPPSPPNSIRGSGASGRSASAPSSTPSIAARARA